MKTDTTASFKWLYGRIATVLSIIILYMIIESKRTRQASLLLAYGIHLLINMESVRQITLVLLPRIMEI